MAVFACGGERRRERSLPRRAGENACGRNRLTRVPRCVFSCVEQQTRDGRGQAGASHAPIRGQIRRRGGAQLFEGALDLRADALSDIEE